MMHTNSSHARSLGNKPTVALVGARGYSGLELAKLLLKHPGVQFTHAYATRAFDLAQELFPHAVGAVQSQSESEILTTQTDIVFLATPAEVSFELAPRLVARGQKVIDLSGAFRLADGQAWYGFSRGQLIAPIASEYGLTPFCGAFNKSTALVANPGCYATAISMALIPLLKQGLIEPQGLVIDAKSGTTGAGRKASENLLFAEVDGQCLPYRVGRHQHLPEIQQTVKQFSGTDIDPHFVTHLLPVKRGIVASIYAEAKCELSDIASAYNEEYKSYPLVKHGEAIESLANLQRVVGTPDTHLSYAMVGKKLYVFAAIDNLLKGAASQAIENLNRLLDLPLGFSLMGEG